MPYIIIKGSRFVKGGCGDNWSRRKDELHKRRKELEYDLSQTIFSKDKMWMRDCHTEAEEKKRVTEYDQWKRTKGQVGKTNEDKMREWSEINKEFKQHNEEGRPQNVDMIRENKVKYE
jgi:hypothetical protein